MKKTILVIAIALSLVGCSTQPPKRWHKNGVTEEQFRRDQITCRQYGMQSAQTHGLAGNLFVETWINDETTKCLKNLGYYVVQEKP